MYLYAKAHNLIGKGCSGSKANGVQCLVGGYDEPNKIYWSSSEHSDDDGSAWSQYFSNGLQGYYGKIGLYFGARAIRAFNNLTIKPFNNLSLNSNQKRSVEKEEENDNKMDSFNSSSSRNISAVNTEKGVDIWDAIDLANHNPQELERLIKENRITDLNKLRNGATPLGAAAAMNEVDIIKLYLNHGAYINLPNEQEQSALMEAAFNGHIDAVRLLIKHGAKVNLRGAQGETALMLAVESGSIDIVRLLVDNGANVSLRDDKAHTALMLAVKSGNIDIVRLLVDRGANVNMRDDEGNTALQLAETLAQRYVKIADLLRDVLAKIKG
jgi:ankyrin repeat protein